MQSFRYPRFHNKYRRSPRTRNQITAHLYQLRDGSREYAGMGIGDNSNAVWTDETTVMGFNNLYDLLFQYSSFFAFFTESGRYDNKSLGPLFSCQYFNCIQTGSCRNSQYSQVNLGQLFRTWERGDALNYGLIRIDDPQ